ncbi:BMP family ABC transporter substrate-binding protein [Nocardioides aquiterrae]|uniref:ABC transporter substrate-binding protein PnrA-like domain-containing protein n=1 Tax=Nocardioides aquiterrae TaxID=203799 RepID=A0ABN1UFU1_9ACTN
MGHRTRLAGLAAVMAAALALSACGGKDGGAASAGGGDETKIGLIQEARPEVEPWSAAWHNAVEAIKADDSGVSSVETFDAYDATRAEPVIRQMLDGGADVMLMSTFVLADTAKKVAKDYPDVPMAVSSFGTTQSPNLNSVTASYLEIGYSTCWLLTKLSPDGRIGIVDAQGAPFETEIEQGCDLGGKAANPDFETVKLSTNSFTDVQANREQVQALLDQGIKQVYLVSGTEDAVGGLRLCEEAKAQCATWGGDAKQWAPTASVLTVNMNWRVVIEDLMDQAKNGLKEVQTYNLTYGSEGLEALDYSDSAAVSDDLKTEFEGVLADLASEKIELPESASHPGFR